jgi:integrase
MIERSNYHDVKAFLDFHVSVKQSDPRTVENYRWRLKYLLEWADAKRLSSANNIKPSFPVYLDNLNGEHVKMCAARFTAICKTARAFFSWARIAFPGRYRGVSELWITTLRPPRSRSEQAELQTRELYSLEDVLKLCSFDVGSSFMLRRSQAAAAFLFLSGMRIGAFVTLPIGCVDLPGMLVLQLPERGVATKNRKAAETSLLNIPALMAVVQEWDAFVRSRLSDRHPWYAFLDLDGELAQLIPDQKTLIDRRHGFNDDLRELCEAAGVRYLSAHKFRHGHAVYCIKRAKDMAQMKAISENLMHATIGITDGIYGRLARDDKHRLITGL